MSEELTTLEWLQTEHEAVKAKLAEMLAAKTAYLDSFNIAKARLEKGKTELEILIEANE